MRLSVFVASALLLASTADAAVQPINDLIQGALRAFKQSTRLSDWEESGLTPEKVFHQLEKTEETAELCRSLLSLAPEDLALFDIESPLWKRLDCASDLQARLKAYWDFNRRQLARYRSRDPLALDALMTMTSVQLPSIERHIDASTGPFLEYADLKEGEIALTFDDGPQPGKTEKILETLQGAGVRANFFEIGKQATSYPELSQRVVSEGHVVGSHTWDHPQLTKLPRDEAEHEILAGRDAVALHSGANIPFFRFPYGAMNSGLRQFVAQKGMANFFWAMDSLDWKYKDTTVLWQNILKELNREKRGIILFHDVHEQTTIVVPHFLEELQARGFATVVFVPH